MERRAHSAAAKKREEQQERTLPKGLRGTRLRHSMPIPGGAGLSMVRVV